MQLKEIALSLGIESYPEAMEPVYENLTVKCRNVCDLALIASLQEEFQLFGEYYDAVVEGAQALENHPAALLWANTVCTYIADVVISDATKVPCPVSDGSPALHMLPMLTLIPLLPEAIASYRRRGFDEETIRMLMGTAAGCIRTIHQRTGKPGLNTGYYKWFCIYAKALIFKLAGFNFELKKLPKYVVCLKNKQDGSLVLLQYEKTMHKSGMVLGAAGCEDPEGAFEAVYHEEADCYYGYPCENGITLSTPCRYPKDQWKIALQPGDDVISFHIPRGADLTPENVLASMQQGLAFAKKAYPDYSVKALMCVSWLLDPTIGELLDNSSKIVKFGNMFTRFPAKSSGMEVFSFVFQGKYADYHDLPENTRLERALKKLYLDGKFVHQFGGILF